jgi:hypothetical protein
LLRYGVHRTTSVDRKQMNEARNKPQIDSRRPLRARRREAGLVAEYIHDLSDRHAGERQPAAERSQDPQTKDERQ